MTKTLNQLGEATDLDTPDLLLTRDTSTGDDKRITLKNSRFSRHGLTESATLSTGTLTIPVGMSTIKLPTTVWDGSSNITISAIAFEGGVQPAVGYEFSVVVPKTTDAGSLTAGALGNEVLIQDGASIAVEANNNADLPCYPNAADNPDQDAVQFAAPYYRLDFRVDSYDGGGDPVVSLVRLPDSVGGSNDRGEWSRAANNFQSASGREGAKRTTTISVGSVYRSENWEPFSPIVFSETPKIAPSSFDNEGAPWVGRFEAIAADQFRLRAMGSSDGDSCELAYTATGGWHA